MPERRKKILVVDENPDGRRVLGLTLRSLDVELVEAENLAQALDILAETAIDLIITELPMGSNLLAGIQLVTHARRFSPGVTILVYTTHVMHGAEETARSAGADEFVSKPAPSLVVVREAIARLLEGSAPLHS